MSERRRTKAERSVGERELQVCPVKLRQHFEGKPCDDSHASTRASRAQCDGGSGSRKRLKPQLRELRQQGSTLRPQVAVETAVAREQVAGGGDCAVQRDGPGGADPLSGSSAGATPPLADLPEAQLHSFAFRAWPISIASARSNELALKTWDVSAWQASACTAPEMWPDVVPFPMPTSAGVAQQMWRDAWPCPMPLSEVLDLSQKLRLGNMVVAVEEEATEGEGMIGAPLRQARLRPSGSPTEQPTALLGWTEDIAVATCDTDDAVMAANEHAEESEEVWERRAETRQRAVDIAKATREYRLYVVAKPRGTRRVGDPTTPDPRDRRLAKRSWKHEVRTWRNALQVWDDTWLKGDGSNDGEVLSINEDYELRLEIAQAVAAFLADGGGDDEIKDHCGDIGKLATATTCVDDRSSRSPSIETTEEEGRGIVSGASVPSESSTRSSFVQAAPTRAASQHSHESDTDLPSERQKELLFSLMHVENA